VDLTLNRRATLVGGAGDDSFRIGAIHADVVITGGAGDDYLTTANAGRDDFRGGPGTDGVRYDSEKDLSISLNDQPDDGVPGERDNIRADVENVTGGAGNDLIVGNPFDNTLDGDPGGDTIWGGGGNDRLVGFDDGDVLFGQDGNDVLVAGRKSTLDGGAGVDTVEGAATDIAGDVLTSVEVVHGS
jgi:Ca2+-binding RTX toxin-like protein